MSSRTNERRLTSEKRRADKIAVKRAKKEHRAEERVYSDADSGNYHDSVTVKLNEEISPFQNETQIGNKYDKRRKIKVDIKKRKKRNPRSIAVQLSLERIVGKFLSIIGIDIVYVVLMVVGFCVVVQADSFIDVSGVDEQREYFVNFDIGEFICDETLVDEFHILQSTKYVFTDASGTIQSVEAGTFFFYLTTTLSIILFVQILFFIISCITIPIKTTRKLKPLYTMAEATKVFSSHDFGDDQYLTLQDAINNLPATGADSKLRTGRKELIGLENAVNDLIERMRESYKSQNRFVSDASHELRTPIAVIQGYANMLDRWGREDPEILNESITAIKSEADNMNRLVENLLFLARGDSGRTNLRLEQVNINQLLCDIYDEFVMINKEHEFRLDLHTEVNAVVDVSLIKQCMRILIDNAIKYSPVNSDIIIRLNSRGNNFYAIEVQDYGIGVKKEDGDKIFERFYRSDPARNRQTGGNGLGLSIAKWIAEKHRGHIELLSYENLGTRLSLVLPVYMSN
ncbi:MAG: HAMP domain-containing histidine kinase [Lachnospiraceae bacterium]|nr:HAMP domain-containing histidine kinase [Lachnospiraceae bacterium]